MASLTNGNDIFELAAERLALTSFRSAMAGYDLGDSSCWDDLWTMLVAEGGTDLACQITGTLHFFVRTMRASRQHKINYFPPSCKRACADECLMLSLLSACQHDMEDTQIYCLNNLLSENEDQRELKFAAQRLSSELKTSGFQLLPVPLPVIQSIIQATCRNCALAAGCTKVH
jgi:hypothetical protein